MIWTLHQLAEFDSLQRDWQRLNQASTGSPLLATEFIVPLLQIFATGNELLACCRIDGQACAMLILTPRGLGNWQTFQPAQAPLGLCVQASELDWSACLLHLLPVLPGFALILGITQQDPELAPRPVTGKLVTTIDYIRTGKITLGGSFESYWAQRGKNLRQNVKKQHARLERDGIATRLEISTAPQDVAQAIADYGRLEGSGWKAEAGTAVHPDNLQGQFYRAMLEAFCRIGRGRIYRYWYDDKVAAMDLCIESNDCIVILKTTYDESIPSHTSPALLMRHEAFAGLFAEGRTGRIEFYGKAMTWHTRWTDEFRTMYHINLVRWHALRRLRDLLRDPLGRVTRPTPTRIDTASSPSAMLEAAS